MDLSEVSEVVTLSNDTDINCYLKKGWKIIHTCSRLLNSETPVKDCEISYIRLGWFGPNPRHPDGYPK